MNKQTASILKKCGVPPHLLGYEYLGEALEMVLKDRNTLRQMTKILYPSIAKKFHTTPSRVERAIRNAVEASFNYLSCDTISEIFGNTIPADKGKTTNGHFIAAVVELVEYSEDHEK